MMKARKAVAAKPVKSAGVPKALLRKHDITVKVGSSIVIDHTGERLLVKAIKDGEITFERDENIHA